MQDVDALNNSGIKSFLRQINYVNFLGWAFIFLAGVTVIIQGVEAYKIGSNIGFPSAGPMTGLQGILVGSLLVIFGIIACGYEVYKIMKQNRK